MTPMRKEQLKKLMEIKQNKRGEKRGTAARSSLDMKMPHEKEVEIGMRIIKEKFLAKK